MSNRVLNVIPAQAGIQLYPNRNLSDDNKIPLRGNDGMGVLFCIYKLRSLIAIFAASGRKPALSGGVEASFRFAFDGMRFAGGAGFSGTSLTLWPPP